MRYHFKVHKEKKGGYWAECLEKDMGVTTQGKTLEELNWMMQDALNLAMDEPMDSDWFPPLPDVSIKGRNVVEVTVDPKIAMATLVRMYRLQSGLTQREVAERMGIKTLSTYQKLESSKTANPEWTTLVRLKQVLPLFPLDLAAA
jgi:predicted RNase H-like HicB family nuclease/DNA-binding XRE family transcriptional regulator